MSVRSNEFSSQSEIVAISAGICLMASFLLRFWQKSLSEHYCCANARGEIMLESIGSMDSIGLQTCAYWMDQRTFLEVQGDKHLENSKSLPEVND
jgi:hypothetical protein